MLAPVWRTRLFALAGSVLATVFGVLIANESYFWPAVSLGLLAAVLLVYLQARPLITVLLGTLLLGYIVGNRGFAQFSLAGAFPLLPAEAVLLVGGAVLVVQSAWHRELPIRRDMVNFWLLLWMLVGTVRLLFGVRQFGLSAIRDYALVYYGAFFFLTQHVAREWGSARFLQRALLVACGLLLLIHPLFSQFPEFFVAALSIRGFPLIFFKDDLAGNFMAMGSLLFFLRFDQTRRLAWLVPSLALAGLMLTTDSRSSIVGLGVGALWLGLVGRWRFAATLTVAAISAVIVLAFAALIRNESWQQSPLPRLYGRVVSMTDPLGQAHYNPDDVFKADNNQFRMVWWRAAISEALETNRWFGLGFGYDLASRFVRQYLPESTEDFTARSPHNVFITVLARMGIIGFAVFLALIVAIAVRTWRALRAPDLTYTSGACWIAAWVLLVCASFGVVLEGPMGAVVFWTVLGVANATFHHPVVPETEAESIDSPEQPARPAFANA